MGVASSSSSSSGDRRRKKLQDDISKLSNEKGNLTKKLAEKQSEYEKMVRNNAELRNDLLACKNACGNKQGMATIVDACNGLHLLFESFSQRKELYNDKTETESLAKALLLTGTLHGMLKIQLDSSETDVNPSPATATMTTRVCINVICMWKFLMGDGSSASNGMVHLLLQNDPMPVQEVILKEIDETVKDMEMMMQRRNNGIEKLEEAMETIFSKIQKRESSIEVNLGPIDISSDKEAQTSIRDSINAMVNLHGKGGKITTEFKRLSDGCTTITVEITYGKSSGRMMLDSPPKIERHNEPPPLPERPQIFGLPNVPSGNGKMPPPPPPPPQPKPTKVPGLPNVPSDNGKMPPPQPKPNLSNQENGGTRPKTIAEELAERAKAIGATKNNDADRKKYQETTPANNDDGHADLFKQIRENPQGRLRHVSKKAENEDEGNEDTGLYPAIKKALEIKMKNAVPRANDAGDEWSDSDDDEKTGLSFARRNYMMWKNSMK
jgi:hypothetical protein